MTNVVVEADELTAVELSFMAFRHRPADPGTCDVCGAEMALARIGGGEVMVYRCKPTSARVCERPEPESRDAEDWEHYLASGVTIAYPGDEKVARVVAEVRRQRAASGESMDVPIGTVFFPFGHGRGLCNLRWVHQGADEWGRVIDDTYAHDPTHAEVEVDILTRVAGV